MKKLLYVALLVSCATLGAFTGKIGAKLLEPKPVIGEESIKKLGYNSIDDLKTTGVITNLTDVKDKTVVLLDQGLSFTLGTADRLHHDFEDAGYDWQYSIDVGEGNPLNAFPHQVYVAVNADGSWNTKGLEIEK